MDHAIMLISCTDQKGITAAVTGFIFQNNGNILHAEQHTDDEENAFFMRIEWDMENFSLSKDDIKEAFEATAQKFEMKWELFFSSQAPRTAIFVSKKMHCLQDILLRYNAGQFHCKVDIIISNHSSAKKIADDNGIEFAEIAKTKDNKEEQEKKEIEILKGRNIELIVLAQYHQIFTQAFVAQYKEKIINIHHSFLPAFAGSDPYSQAYEKGVKIIGATSHYVTAELDQGPIIEQGIERISHKDNINDLKRIGEDLEKVVLARAVRWHLERKILSYKNKTVIFD